MLVVRTKNLVPPKEKYRKFTLYIFILFFVFLMSCYYSEKNIYYIDVFLGKYLLLVYNSQYYHFKTFASNLIVLCGTRLRVQGVGTIRIYLKVNGYHFVTSRPNKMNETPFCQIFGIISRFKSKI